MVEPAFLLDTNICIYLLGGCADVVRSRVEQCEPGELAVSAVTFAEVMIGVRSLKAHDEAMALFGVTRVLPFDEAAAATYARLPFRRGSFDRLIVAHAIALDLTLVTNNERDFGSISGLRIENWTR